MNEWAMVAIDDGDWREGIASELATAGVLSFSTQADPRDLLACLLEDDQPLPSVLVWSSATATEDDFDRLHELHHRGVGVILTADHRTLRELRRADRGGLMSRAWRYGAAAVVARDDVQGLARVARELLRSPVVPRASSSWQPTRQPAA